jgi:uncharacterized protein YabN with tetrapyrrole methylase and pyrophosphatase domain
MTAPSGHGSLTVVGTGIQLGTQLTAEARACLAAADEVLYLVADPTVMSLLERLNPNARSLHSLYEPGRSRRRAYAEITEHILERVRTGASVCAAFYGHPGVFVRPSHEAIARARAEGFPATMLPAVSAEDCLFADLGVDPGRVGCQSYEATDFLLRKRKIDVSAALILWQIAVVGNLAYAPEGDTSQVDVLVERLLVDYPADHETVLYEASLYPVCDPVIVHVPLSELAVADISPMSTLYVPPAEVRPLNPEVAARLGIAIDEAEAK